MQDRQIHITPAIVMRDSNALLCVLEHTRALNCALSVERLERMLSVYRAWVTVPGSVEGGYALTRDELDCVLEFPHDPRTLDFLFQTFKTQSLERVDLLTLLTSATLVCRGTLEAKAKFVFTLVDLDTEDDIVEEELALIISTCSDGLARLGVHSAPLLEMDALAIAYEAFAFAEIEESGKMSFAAFLQWCVFHERPRALFDRISFLLSMSNVVASMHAALGQHAAQAQRDPFHRYNAAHWSDDDAQESSRASVLVGPILGKVTATSVTLLLELDSTATVQVFAFEVASRERGTAPRLGASMAVDLVALNPRAIVLEGLEPGTTYSLRLLGVCRQHREARVAFATTSRLQSPESSDDSSDAPQKWRVRTINHSRPSTAAPSLSAFEQAMYARAAYSGYSSAALPLLTVHYACLRIPRAKLAAMAAVVARDREGKETSALVSSMLAQCYRDLLSSRELAPLLRYQANVLLDRSDDVLFGDESTAPWLSQDVQPVLAQLAHPVWQRYIGSLWDGGETSDGCIEANGLLLVLPSAHMQTPATLTTALTRHESTESLVLVTRAPILSPMREATADATSQEQQRWELLDALVAWKRSGLSRSVLLLSFAHDVGCESTLSVKDTTISIRQCICGPLSGVTQACSLEQEQQQQVQTAAAMVSEQLHESLVIRHHELELAAHVAVLDVVLDPKQRRLVVAPTLERLHASRSIRVLVGPVIGWVSSTAARILLECDAEGDIVCVLTDRITGERVLAPQRTKPRAPVLFHIQRLRSGRLYDVHIRGLAEPCTAVLQTPYDDSAPSWTLAIVSDDILLDARVSAGSMTGGVSDAKSSSLVDNIVSHALPVAPGLRVDATLHLGVTVALAHDLARAYRLFAHAPSPHDGAAGQSDDAPLLARCDDLVREAVRRHWSLRENQLLLARGAHVFSSVGLLRSLLLESDSMRAGVPRAFLARLRTVLREYEAVGGVIAASASSPEAHLRRLHGGVALLTLDTLENVLSPETADATTTPFAQLQATLLSPSQWRALEAVLAVDTDVARSGGDELQLLVILCDVPLVWHDAETDMRGLWHTPTRRTAPVHGVLGNAWSLFPTELDKLLALIFRAMHQRPAFHVTVVCSGPHASRTTIRDPRTALELEQIVLGPVSTPPFVAAPPPPLVRSGTLLDERYAYTHDVPPSAQRSAQYCVLELVAHPRGSTSAAHFVVQHEPDARVLVGPVVGRVTPRTARILIELDRAVTKCVCVLTDTTSAQRFATEASVDAYSPTVFKMDVLRPGRRYAIAFEGILATASDGGSALGYVETPPLVSMAFEWVVAHHNVMANFVRSDDSVEQADAARDTEPRSYWSRIVAPGMRAYTAQACAATSSANGETLGERSDVNSARFNPWFAVQDAFVSEPMKTPLLVVHLGGQVDMRRAFADDELRALVARLGSADSDTSESLLVNDVRHRLQEVYRIAWGVPPLKSMLAHASNVMLLNEALDLFFSPERLRAFVTRPRDSSAHDRCDAAPSPSTGFTDAAISRTAAILRAAAFECWQRYQNQLWVDVNERDVVPNAVKNSTKFAAAATFGLCRMVFMNVSHDVHELRSALAPTPSSASAKLAAADAAPAISLFTNATWKTLEDALLPAPPAATPAAATAPPIQQLVVVIPADFVAWTKALPQLRPDFVRVLEKCFAWKMERPSERRAVIVCSSDAGSSLSFDVTDEKLGETLALSCVGSISEPRAIVQAAAQSSSKKRPTAAPVIKGHFSKRYTYQSTLQLASSATQQHARAAALAMLPTAASTSASPAAPSSLQPCRTFASYQFLSDYRVGFLNESLHYFPPKASPRATLGPVLGRIAFSSARERPVDSALDSNDSAGANGGELRRDATDADALLVPTATALILLEINASAKVACVVTDSLANRDIRVVHDLERDCPFVFRVAGLLPERRYVYRFEGISNAASRRGCFHTPSADARTLNVVALSSSFPEHMDPSRESLWVPLLQRVQLPWCGIDAVLHVGGQVPLQEAAVDCLAWLERERRKPRRRAAETALRRKVRKRLQQHYRVSWNLPHVRELLASVSNWFLPTQADVAPFLRNDQVVDADSAMAIVLDVAKHVVAEYQLALLHHDDDTDASDTSTAAAASVERPRVESPRATSATDSKTAGTGRRAVVAPDAAPGAADRKTPRPPQREAPPSPPDAADHPPSPTTHAFIEHGEIGFFFCDMRRAAPSDVITCNGRLATPLKAQEHAVVNDAQWLALERALKRKRVLLLVLVMEFPLVLTSAAFVNQVRDQQTQPPVAPELYDHRALAQHWVACKRQLEQLLALLFRWKAKRRGRDVLVLSGGVRVGLETLMQETTRASPTDAAHVLTLQSLACGPVTARVEPFEFPLSGVACPTFGAKDSDGRFTFHHRRVVAKRNYVLAQLTVGPDALAGGDRAASSDADTHLAATVDASFVCESGDGDDPSRAHPLDKYQRYPTWWRAYIPMGRAVFWDDTVVLAAASDETMQALQAFVYTDRGFSAALDVFYEQHAFAETARMAELRSANRAAQRFDLDASLRAAFADVWRAVPETKRAHMAYVLDPFVLDFLVAHVAPTLRTADARRTGAVAIELAFFQTLCRDVVYSACVLHLAVRMQCDAAARARAQAAQDARDRAAQDARAAEQAAAARLAEDARLAELLRTDPEQFARECLARDRAVADDRAARKRDKLARKQAERLRELDEERAIAKEQRKLNALAATDAQAYVQRQQLLETRIRRLEETRAQRAAAKAHKQQQQTQTQESAAS